MQKVFWPILLPVLTTLAWLGTILALLLLWTVEDSSSPYERGTSVVMISDVGAEHRTGFIVGCTLTFVLYTFTLISERYLRFKGMIPGAESANEVQKTSLRPLFLWDLGMAGVVFGFLGGVGLLVLSVFDINNNRPGHWVGLLMFILGAVISASCHTAMVARLRKTNPTLTQLRRTTYLKITIIILTLILAVCFMALMGTCGGESSRGPDGARTPRCNTIISAAAIFEWLAALFFDFYLATFILDFIPSTAFESSDAEKKNIV